MYSTCFSYKITYKNIRVNRGEVSREVCQRRVGGDDDFRYIKHDLLCDTLRREDGGLRDVELQTSI
jgi:hypothetical protein